jgi:hypothetical protein
MSRRPIIASVLSIIGGSIVVFFSLLIFPFYYFVGGPSFGITGIISGIMMIFGGARMSTRPDQHRFWGFFVLIFSVLSIMGLFGGYFIGLTLGIIGGILSIRWKPTPNLP